MHNGYAADAVSYAAGIVLLLLLVEVLCAIVVASLFRVFSVSAEIPGLVPKIIAIGVIHHENPAGIVTYSGRPVSDSCRNTCTGSLRTQ